MRLYGRVEVVVIEVVEVVEVVVVVVVVVVDECIVWSIGCFFCHAYCSCHC